MVFLRKSCLLLFAYLMVFSSCQLCKPLSEKDNVMTMLCLTRHVRLLELLEYYSRSPNDVTQILAYEGIPFEHPLISWGAQMVQAKKTLMPFVSIWKLFKDCKTGDHNCDKEFLLECARFICITYQQILTYKIQEKVTLTDVITLYSRIALLPLPELLTVLDELYEHIKVIMDDYKTDEPFSMITWIQNYWWVPPVAAASLVISYLKWASGR